MTATLERPTIAPEVIAAVRQAARMLPIAQRREFVAWIKLIRKRGYTLDLDNLEFSRLLIGNDGTGSEFAELVATATGHETSLCYHVARCHRGGFNDDLTFVESVQEYVCQPCLDRHYFNCQDCDELQHVNERRYISGNNEREVCQSCFGDGDYGTCYECGNAFHIDDLHSNDDGDAYYCERHWNPERSDCPATHLEFSFPALCTPNKTVANDEVIAVTVGTGDVSPQGMGQLRQLIYSRTSPKDGRYAGYSGIDVSELIDEDAFDSAWQNREGNLPKRLAKHLLVARSLKLSDELMAECGNVAKQYVSKVGTRYVSLTRDLNLPADEFYHDSSCWWGAESYSRCELKAWHGFGFRTYESADDDGASPTGRAWILPLRVVGSEIVRHPTHELPADAYVLFNAYGMGEDDAKMAMARIIAGMTGKSYRKLERFNMHAYVNSGGILIAEQSICDTVRRIELPTIADCGCN